MSRAREAINRIVSNAAPSTAVVGAVVKNSGGVYDVAYTDRMGNEVTAQGVAWLSKKGIRPPELLPGDLVLIGFVNGSTNMPYIIDLYYEPGVKDQRAEYVDRASALQPGAPSAVSVGAASGSVADRIRAYHEASHKSPVELLRESFLPAPGDFVIKNPDPRGQQVIKFRDFSEVSIFSGPFSGIKLYGGENCGLVALVGDVMASGGLSVSGNIEWAGWSMNPALRGPVRFLVLTPQVEAALNRVLSNPSIGGAPGMFVSGEPVFLSEDARLPFSGRSLMLMEDLGIKLEELFH